MIDGAYVRGAARRSRQLGLMRVAGPDGPGEQIQTLRLALRFRPHLATKRFKLSDVMGDYTPAPKLDACVAEWIEQAATQLCGPLDAVNCLINPAMVLMGGRLPGRLVEQLADRTNALLRDHAGQLPTLAPVARAALSEDAPAVGAAILPFSHFLLPKPGALWKAPTGGVIEDTA